MDDCRKTHDAFDCPEILMYEHVDPGFLTIAPRASAHGLEVLDQESGEWCLVESELEDGDLIVFACATLQEITKGAIKGTLHRVIAADCERHAIAYELRCLEPSVFS